VAAPFVGTALQESFVTFTATVTDANGNRGTATKTFQLTHSAANGDQLTPQPTSSDTALGSFIFPEGIGPVGRFGR
jgi:hypothetical protein